MIRTCSLATFAVAALLAAAPLAAQTPPAPPSVPATVAPAIPLTPAEEARFLELGKTYTRWFLTFKADSLVGAFAAEMAEKVGGVDGVKQMMDQIAERAGSEIKITEEKMTRRKGLPQFWHAGQFSELADDELVIRWIFDKNGKIAGAGINPKTAAPPPDAQ